MAFHALGEGHRAFRFRLQDRIFDSLAKPAIEAIMLQLMQKEMAGNARAARTLLKYREFATQNGEKQLEVIFVESDYTKALSGQSAAPGGGND